MHNPMEYKIVVTDNSGFYFIKNIGVTEYIFLPNKPPYKPELNLCEQIGQ